MRNVLFVINNVITAVHELVRVADLVRRAPDLRPAAFLEESTFARQHPAVRAMLEERGIEVMSSEQFSGADGRAALGRRGSARRRIPARLLCDVLAPIARLVPSWHPIIRGLKSFRQNIHDIRDATLRPAAVLDAELWERR